MTEGQTVQVRLTWAQIADVLGRTWHFVILLAGFIYMVTAWKDTQEEHLRRIDDQLQIEKQQIDLEDQKLDWLMRHIQNPHDASGPTPESLMKPKTQGLSRPPLISKNLQQFDAKLPNY